MRRSLPPPRSRSWCGSAEGSRDRDRRRRAAQAAPRAPAALRRPTDRISIGALRRGAAQRLPAADACGRHGRRDGVKRPMRSTCHFGSHRRWRLPAAAEVEEADARPWSTIGLRPCHADRARQAPRRSRLLDRGAPSCPSRSSPSSTCARPTAPWSPSTTSRSRSRRARSSGCWDPTAPARRPRSSASRGSESVTAARSGCSTSIPAPSRPSCAARSARSSSSRRCPTGCGSGRRSTCSPRFAPRRSTGGR